MATNSRKRTSAAVVCGLAVSLLVGGLGREAAAQGGTPDVIDEVLVDQAGGALHVQASSLGGSPLFGWDWRLTRNGAELDRSFEPLPFYGATDPTPQAENLYNYTVSVLSTTGATRAFTVAYLAGASGLQATAASEEQIDLTWQDNSMRENAYDVWRSTNGVDFVRVAQLGANATAYSDRRLNGSTPYTYRISPVATGADFSFADSYPEERAVTGRSPLAAPSGLSASVVGGRLVLRWADNSANERGFQVERILHSGNDLHVVQVGAVGANVRQFLTGRLPLEERFVFRVRAVGAAGFSSYSNRIVVSTLAAPVLRAVQAVSSTQVRLSWQDRSGLETAFRIERRQGTGPWLPFTTVPAGPGVGGTLDVTRGGLAAETAYSFRLVASAPGSESAPSNTLSVRTLAAPTGPAVRAVSSSQAEVSWVDPSGFETGFRVERRLADGSWALWLSAPARAGAGGQVTLVKSGLVPGETYVLRVRSLGANAVSTPSTVVNVTMPR